MSSILIKFTSGPYESGATADGLDFAISATNYGHDVAALFSENAVWMWHQNQGSAPGIKNIAKRLKSLPLFDIDNLYVCKQALAVRNVNLTAQTHIPLDSDEITALIRQFDHVVTF